MKNTYIFLLGFLISSFNLFAQENIKLSENFTVEVGEEFSETAGGIKEFYRHNEYVIKFANHKRYDLIIQKFDPITLKEIERIEKVGFFEDTEKGKLIRVERVGDNVVFLYRLWDKKNDSSIINIRTISLNDLVISDFKTVLSIGDEISTRAFDFKVSFDKTKFLVLYKLNPSKDKELKKFERYSVNVFDKNVDKIWSNNIKIPYKKTVCMNLDYSIDNEGSFYFLTRVYKDEKSKKKKPFLNPDSSIELLELHKDANDFVISKIDVDDYFVDMTAIGQNPKGGVMVTGTLGKIFDMKKKDGVLSPIGFFFSYYDKAKGLLKVNRYNFQDKILNKYKEDTRILKKYRSKLGPYFNNLKITDVVYSDEESILLIGEQYNNYSRSISSASIGYTHSTVSRRFDDIYVAKILSDGSLAWSQRLPKQQRVDNRGASEMSFEYVGLNGKHYLFYQDHIANLNRAEDEAPSPLWDLTTGYLMAYVINDENGSITKEPIFNLADVNNGKKLENFITDNILKLSSSEILIEGFNGDNKDFLVKVKAR
ncbi:hypothetical protein [Aquimarina litoralis]|uniref:hypothetical protein n=1 Tax=Aquimarina litoralis TaxID=584605 RepID=UPI001C56731E|nr:hypothetical protein [Aquimarina litoralis]MBW1298221.1 hypothetical protein [Aquimarina litoralis]